jgi:hypothetical protein
MAEYLSQTAMNTRKRTEPAVEKLPGHWVLARMGKRVLRPGGLDLTRRMLAELAILPSDDIVEFAPGLGVTARLALACKPRSYTALERDPDAAAAVNRFLSGAQQRCVVGTAEETWLPDRSATVVYGEAMLSMQPPTTKLRIVRKAASLLKSGGRYGIHELCLVPDHLDDSIRNTIQDEMSDAIHVGVRPLTLAAWIDLFQAAGLEVVAAHTTPMHLLEPVRLLKDEGLLRAVGFAWNIAMNPAARRRVLKMRSVFRKYNQYLAAVAIVAKKPGANLV